MMFHVPFALRWLLPCLVLVLGIQRSALADDDDSAVVRPTLPPVASVHVVPLRMQSVSQTVVAYGQVAQDPARLQTVSLARAGQVIQLAVRAGQHVRRGDLLLTFARSAAVTQTWRQAQTAVQYAEAERARVAQLRSQQLATVSQLDAADRALADARSALEAARSSGSDSAQTWVRAPFDGWVQSVSVAVGDRVAADAPLLQLGPESGQGVLLDLDAVDRQRVHAGLAVRIVPLMTGSPAQDGTLAYLADVINPSTQQVSAVVRVAGHGLLPGERVRGEIALGAHRALVVPRTAVLDDGNGDCIYQVRGGRAWRVAVQRGIESGDVVAVSGKLLPDAPVVALGNYELQNGMAVRQDAP